MEKRPANQLRCISKNMFFLPPLKWQSTSSWWSIVHESITLDSWFLFGAGWKSKNASSVIRCWAIAGCNFSTSVEKLCAAKVRGLALRRPLWVGWRGQRPNNFCPALANSSFARRMIHDAMMHPCILDTKRVFSSIHSWIVSLMSCESKSVLETTAHFFDGCQKMQQW